MNRQKRYGIDGERLKEAIRNTGYSLRDASKEIGYAPNFFSQVCGRRYTSKSVLTALEKHFDISYADIKPLTNTNKRSENNVKQLIPETDEQKYFEVISALNLIGKSIQSQQQQIDEVIDLLIRTNVLMGDLLEVWKPSATKVS